MRRIRSYDKVCKFLDSSKTHALRRQHEPIVLVNERIHGRAPAVCSYSIRIFQVHAMVVHAMNTLEFYSFGVKITYSRINVYTHRTDRTYFEFIV